MLQNKNILISGAGIAGLTTAYWLKLYDFNVVVVERAESIREGGWAIDIRNDSIQLAQMMEIWDEIKAKSTKRGDDVFVDENNKSKAKLNVLELQKGIENGEVEIMLSELAKIIYTRIKNSVEFIFDDSIVEINEDDKGVEIKFEKSSPRRFDLIIGADGLHSKVRKLIFGNTEQYEKFLGYYVATFTIDNYLGLDTKTSILAFNKPGKLAAIANYKSHVLSNKEAVGFFIFKNPKRIKLNYRDVNSQKEFVRNTFKNDLWEIPTMLAKMEQSKDFYFDEMVQMQMPTWSKGRVVLVGDSGYSASTLTGLGTAHAMLGGYILANELNKYNGNYIHAYKDYYNRFYKYVKKGQELIIYTSKFLVPENSFQIWLRNLTVKSLVIFKLIPKSILERISSKPSTLIL